MSVPKIRRGKPGTTRAGIATSALVAVALCVSACSTNLRPGLQTNPPPPITFSAASSVRLEPLRTADDIAEREPKVVQWMREKFDSAVRPVVDLWKDAPKDPSGPALSVTPTIEKLKYIGRAERFFGGALVGGSAIVTSLRVTDTKTGEVVAAPVFYQHANAWGSAYSFGGTDEAILDRVVLLMRDYLTANYREPTSFRTGE